MNDLPMPDGAGITPAPHISIPLVDINWGIY